MKVGQTVIVQYHSVHSGMAFNGERRAPAIVNRVWGDDCVNVTVLPDCGVPFCETSVQRIPDGCALNAGSGFYDVDSFYAENGAPEAGVTAGDDVAKNPDAQRDASETANAADDAAETAAAEGLQSGEAA